MNIAEEKKHLRSCIQRVATGPEYSKDLPFEDAKRAMDFILSGKADPVQIAVLLVGMRMKRETDEENRGCLTAIVENTRTAIAQTDHIVDIADAYNGHVRGLPAIPFLPAVLAACGVPAVSHGVENVGPKFGITTSRVLKACGVDTNLTPEQIALKAADPDIGWGYVDQKNYCPTLYDLIPLRTIIVKRTLLTTLECIIGPVRGRQSTTLLTGYVHKAYPPVYTELAKVAGFDNAIVIRGVEGGIMPSLQQEANVFYYEKGGEMQKEVMSTAVLGMQHTTRATPLPKDLPVEEDIYAEEKPPFDLAKAVELTVDAGMSALQGKAGTTRDQLVYTAAITLLRRHKAASLQQAAQIASQVIDSGKALAHFNAALA